MLPPCVKKRSERGPNRRPRRVVQNPPAKKKQKVDYCAQKKIPAW
jgi:hypothetical protein